MLEAWRFRETIRLMVSNQLKSRYRRSVLGFLWAFLNPLIQITVLAVVFGLIIYRDEPDLKKAINTNFVYIATGLLPWGFFQTALAGLSAVFLGAEGIVKKIYLPLVIFPLAQIISSVIDLCLALMALLLLFIGLGVPIHPTALLALPAIVLLAIFSFGLTLIIATANVYFRDIGFIVGVLTQLWFYATPIIYPLAMIPLKYQWVFKANPFWNFLWLFRLTLMDGTVPPPHIWLKCALCASVSFLIGYSIYGHYERKMIFRL